MKNYYKITIGEYYFSKADKVICPNGYIFLKYKIANLEDEPILLQIIGD